MKIMTLTASSQNAIQVYMYCFCLFDYFELHEQVLSYLAAATITDDRASNSDLCLALTAFSCEGSFT
jgi:hypothetical protein